MKAIIVAAALLGLTVGAEAETYKLGSLEIETPWARATPKGATVAAGYATIRNTGATADRLTGGSVEVSKRFELHSMAMDQGVMRMRPVKGGLEIKPGESVELRPGSFHMMFVDLNRPLQEGDRFNGTLVFERAGKVDVDYRVEGIGRQPPHAGGAQRH